MRKRNFMPICSFKVVSEHKRIGYFVYRITECGSDMYAVGIYSGGHGELHSVGNSLKDALTLYEMLIRCRALPENLPDIICDYNKKLELDT